MASPGRVRIEPYQLVPLMRALELPRPRLLLADGVGLGKTIEAGLIACELIARRRAHRVLIVAPAGPLLTQWAQETAATVRAALHRDRRCRVHAGAAAQARARRQSVRCDRAVPDCRSTSPSRSACSRNSNVRRGIWRSSTRRIIVSATATSTDREETQRRRLAEVIARRSDGLLLLTATPHDGYDAHFASLIELLDPSLVDGRGGLVGTAYRRHVVRRLKQHIRDPATGMPLFRERRVDSGEGRAGWRGDGTGAAVPPDARRTDRAAVATGGAAARSTPMHWRSSAC